MLKKINHNRRIMSKSIISKKELIPGMIISFRYRGSDIYDKNPLILFLFNDTAESLIHGINLNYLYERDIQEIFRKISKKVNINIEYENENHGYPRVSLNRDSKSKTGVGAKRLYEEILKPHVMTTHRTKDCYRTYKSNKMTGLMLNNYRLDVIEEILRKQSGLSKHKLKTAELFKNVEEQEIETSTENVETKSQDEIRKDIQK